MPQYQPGVPSGTVNLDVDYQNIQDNFQQLNVAYGVDHVAFSDNSGVPTLGISGMHNIIHLRSNATPAALVNVGQFFNAVVNDGLDTDTILYYVTGKGKLIELTSNIQPVRTSNNGITFLPGGLILQWGQVTTAVKNSITAVTLGTTFPNAFLSMQGTLSAGTSGAVITLIPAAVPAFSTFNYFINTNSSQTLNFFWWAIGY